MTARRTRGISWDTRRQPDDLKNALRRNGYTPFVQHGFRLIFETADGIVCGFAVFSARTGELSYAQVAGRRFPPQDEHAQFRTARNRLDNLVRFLDEQEPTDYQWQDSPIFAAERPPAPVTPIRKDDR